MKALIIGGSGFVGTYLAAHLKNDKGYDVTITGRNIQSEGGQYGAVCLDVLDFDAIRELLEEKRPDCIFHLAAISSVSVCWKRPQAAVDVNIKGIVNLLEAVRAISSYSPRILAVGSGEEYGPVRPVDVPVNEHTPVRPGNVYAATKAAQNMICAIYARAYGMDIVMARAFNHIGPGQEPLYVVSDFCKQVADIEKGLHEPVMKVGNLAAKRDFSDVRDVVRAYGLLVEKGVAGQTYNIGSGHAISIRELLDRIVAKSTVEISIEVDQKKLRPVDVPLIEADTSKIYNDTGWRTEIDLEDTISRTLEYWRGRV